MKNPIHIAAAVFGLCLTPLSITEAAGLDYQRPVVCDLDYLQMCEHGDHRCQWGNVVNDGGRQTLNIDLGISSIALLEDGKEIVREPIASSSEVKGNLYVHGTNPDASSSADGTGWMLRITTKDGTLSVAVLADTSSFFLFGNCYNPEP